MLGLPDLRVSATCVRVPVITTHSVAVHATFARKIDVAEARQALVEAPAVVVLDDPESLEFPTPVDTVGSDPRFAGRLRQALDFPNTLDFFICGDNLRKGGGAQHGAGRRARREATSPSSDRPVLGVRSRVVSPQRLPSPTASWPAVSRVRAAGRPRRSRAGGRPEGARRSTAHGVPSGRRWS